MTMLNTWYTNWMESAILRVHECGDLSSLWGHGRGEAGRPRATRGQCRQWPARDSGGSGQRAGNEVEGGLWPASGGRGVAEAAYLAKLRM